MAFIDGYLALASVVGAGTCTELTLPGYNRQPISFGDPVSGVAFSAVPYSFGQALRPAAAGRAIFDAPAGGNLLLVLPFPVPLSGWRLPWDTGEAGHLRILFTAMVQTYRGGAFTGRIAAGAVAGQCSDACDVLNPTDQTQVANSPRPLINLATMTAGVALSINRGLLQPSAAVPAGTE